MSFLQNFYFCSVLFYSEISLVISSLTFPPTVPRAGCPQVFATQGLPCTCPSAWLVKPETGEDLSTQAPTGPSPVGGAGDMLMQSLCSSWAAAIPLYM